MNRTLVHLLQTRETELSRRGITWQITGVATRKLGWLADPNGVKVEKLLADKFAPPPETAALSNVSEWLKAARADVLFEATSLSVADGQPAIQHLRAALESGAHAITANKGPIVHAYEELNSLAQTKGKRFLFESTVMDGVPIFSMFRDGLPLVDLRGFTGILNSTTNVILSGMEAGLSFAESLQQAQQLGIAETDPRHDVDGWDAALKTAALIRVLMGVPLKLDQVQREGIGSLTGEAVRAARAEGKPYKLVCRALRFEGGVYASVGPQQVPSSGPLASVEGTSSILQLETDIFPLLTITEDNPGLEATAYGMLADFIRAVT